MKKFLVGITTAALIAVMTVSTFAAGEPVKTSDSISSTQSIHSQRKEFKESLKPLKATLKANQEKNQKLRDSNKALLDEIKEKLAALKQSETKLTVDQKSTIKSLRQEIAALRNELQDTKGEIKSIFEANKTNVKDMDLKAVQAAYDKIYEIQKYRNERLTKINKNLASILSTVN